MVNHFIPVLGEPRTLTFDFERERGKSIKRLHVLRCQVTLAKRQVFFLLRCKQRKRSSQGYDIPI